MAEHSIAKLASVAGRIKSEMRYWSGYDPELLTDFTDEVEHIERWIKDNDDSKRRHAREVRGSVLQFLIVCSCIAGVIIGIAYMCSHWSDAVQKAKDDLRNDQNFRIEEILKGWNHSVIEMDVPNSSAKRELEFYFKFK